MTSRAISPHLKLSSPATREFWEIPVRWEDESLIALDKPAYLLTSPDRYDPERPNLMTLLHRDIKRNASWVRERAITYLANAHRLDFETSGILLLARNKPALIHLANQFGSEKPLKTYVALVRGSPAHDAFAIDAKLAPHPTRPELIQVDPRAGKKSSTRFEVLERFSGYTVIACHPLTVRTHQIRVHLRHAGFPIIGDALYGGRPLLLSQLKPQYRLKPGREERPLISRVALHATYLEVTHPVTGGPVVIESPWPKDITVAVKYLRRYKLGASESSNPPPQGF